MITVAEIVERIEKVDMMGLLGVRPSEKGQKVALVELWRLGGAFRNDRERKITMVIDPAYKKLKNELFFYVPSLEDCQPGDKALTIYMTANTQAWHGGHEWSAKNEEVHFSYAMPIPPGVTDFPDTALFGRLLKDMYEGLLFRELKMILFQIDEDLMLSPEEKKAKFEQAQAMRDRLAGPREPDAEGV